MADAAATQETQTRFEVDYQTDPSKYRHWKLSFDGPVATLLMDVDEEGGLRPGYKLKLNSYDLGVDIELHDALQRIRFEHPEIRTVVLTSAKSRIFCSGANIYMLGLSTHAWKVNFCKFTNETRNGIEDSSAHSGLKFLAACNGATAGCGYTDDSGRFEGFDGSEKISNRRMLVGVSQLMLGQIVAAFHHQAARIHHPAALLGGVFGESLGYHGGNHQVGDAGGGLARTEEQQLLLGELAAVDAQRRENACQRNCRRALDIVVESADPIAVFLQQAECIVISEILELNHHPRKHFARRSYEFV